MPQYEIPAIGTPTPRLLGWLLEAVSEGQAWLSAQRPAVEWDTVINALSTTDASGSLNGLSSVGYDKAGRIARELVASLANFEHAGEFKPRFDQKLYNQAHALSKLDHNWEIESDAYEAHRGALQHGIVLGTGYLVEEWDKSLYGNTGDIALTAYAPSDVTFVQLPKNHNVQQAYMVIIRDEMPINLARATYPTIAHLLEPDRDTPNWLMKGIRAVQKLMGGSPALRVAGNNPNKNTASFPTVDIFRAYIVDRSINMSGVPMIMGAEGTNWSYTVPALGDQIPTGVRNPATGNIGTRPAEQSDCRLFPLRRYTIFSRTAVAYDGSSPWWHGQVPVARYRFNDWAWEALGKSIIGGILPMQTGIIALMRCIEDAMAARLDPPALYDDSLVSKGFAEAFNPRKAGVRASADLQRGDVIKFPVPLEHYNVPEAISQHLKDQEARMDYQAGTPDLIAIAKAKQVPGEGTLEKLMEMAGPLVQDMVRGIESPLRQLGEWRKAYYFQFYTQGRIIQTVGDDNELADEQFQPTMIVPAIPGEPVSAKTDRTRRYLNEFKYRITESGVNEIHRMTTKLAFLQLSKAGMPIDWWTLAKIWQVPNFGPPPEGAQTVVDRFVAQKQIEYELAAEGQQHAAELGLGGNQVGRPPTYNRPPRLVQKDGGSRSTITTS